MQGISVVIPVYNEEEIIRENTLKLISYLNNLDVAYEIILASNGSTDKTVLIGRELAKDPRVVFFHLKHKGVGNAFKRSLFLSKYPYIMSLDMDLSIDLSFIDNSLKLMKKYSIVIGSKQVGTQNRSFLRKIPSAVFTFLVRILLGLKYRDYSMAAKVYRKDVVMKYQNVFDSGTSYVIDTVYLAKKSGEPIIEIPVDCFDRRESKFNILNEAVYRFKRLIYLWAKF